VVEVDFAETILVEDVLGILVVEWVLASDARSGKRGEVRNYM
jgi:hypothetical protein